MTAASPCLGRGGDLAVSAGRPGPQPGAQHQVRAVTLEHKCPVGQVRIWGLVERALTGPGIEPLGVQLEVDRVRSLLVGVEL